VMGVEVGDYPRKMLVAVHHQQLPGSFQEGHLQQEVKVQVAWKLWVAVVGSLVTLQVLPLCCVFFLGGGEAHLPKSHLEISAATTTYP
jgi:hypothetical protein